MSDSGTYDLATITRRQQIAEQMLQDASKPREIRHWTQGLAQLGDTAAATFALNRADSQAKAARQQDIASLMSVLGPNQQPSATPSPATPAASPSPSPAPRDPNMVPANSPGVFGSDAVMTGGPNAQGIAPPAPSAAGNAISGIESGGRYDAQGPVITRGQLQGDRAYGKYQVMGSNVGPWTKQHYGQELSPEDFLKNPDAQEAVFKGKFGEYQKQFGSPELAARAWFAGPGNVNNPGATDQLGTTAGAYGAKVASAAGGPQAVAAAMSPSANPASGPQITPPIGSSMPAPAPQGGPQAAPTPPVAPGGTALPANAAQGIPTQQREAIARLLTATPGSAAAQLGIQLAGQSLKPHDYGFQTLPDGTILRTDPHSGTVTPIYNAPTKPQPMKLQTREGGETVVFVDPNSKKIFGADGKEISGANGQGILGGTPHPELSGQDYLKTIEPGRRDIITGMLEGRMAPAQLGRYGNKAVQSLMEDAARVEPGFDMTTFQGRQKSINDFYGGGKSQETVRKLNQSALHFGELVDKMGELPGHQVPAANKVHNWVNTQLLGKGAEGNFIVNGHALADELAGLFKGAGISDTEIRSWESRLSPNLSPEQQQGMAKTLAGLYRDGMTALEKKRQDALGPTLAGRRAPVLGEEADKAITRVEKFGGGQKLEPQKQLAPSVAPGALPDGWSVQVH